MISKELEWFYCEVGNKQELKGLKLLETYVRCVRFTMTINAGKKPFADRCAELQQAVLAYPELQRHIAAGTIPKVPKATITTEATNQAKHTRKGRQRNKTNVRKRSASWKKEKALDKRETDIEAREADFARRVQVYGKFVEQRG